MSRLGAIAIALAAGLALADASIVTLGLPAILIELDSTVDGVALVLGVYTVVLAVLLPLASKLATRFGPAQIAAWGAALFGLASAGCGAVSDLTPLLTLRALQAVGGAGVLVGAFELLDAGRPGGGRRLWVAASVYGIAIGPALGGALTQAFDWRAIFLVQVPVAIGGLVAAVVEIRRGHETEPEQGVALDALPRRPTAALALLSAALTAVIFLVVLLLVAGWSVEPLAAAATVSVLPVAAILASRVPGDPDHRAAAGCMLVGAGVCCLALLPGASPWWTVAPQVLAGAGMGLSLPALSGELIPERNRADMARLLSIRHVGIALALAILAPVISSSLDSTIKQAREEGTAAILDSGLDPQTKIDIAPQLLAGVDDEDPRGQLEDSFAEVESEADLGDRPDIQSLGDRLDSVITGAVRSAFRVAFLVTGGLALVAALLLLTGIPGPISGRGGALLVGGAVAAFACAGVYAVAFERSDRERVKIGDPCQDRDLPDAGGVGGLLQGVTLQGLDRTACDFGSSREELLLAIFDSELRKEYEKEYGKDPRSPIDVGGALLGL